MNEKKPTGASTEQPVTEKTSIVRERLPFRVNNEIQKRVESELLRKVPDLRERLAKLP